MPDVRPPTTAPASAATAFKTIGRVRAFTKKTTGGGATQTWSAPRLRFTKDASFLIVGFFRPGV